MNKKFLFKGFVMILFAIVGSFVIYRLEGGLNGDIRRIDLDKYKKVMFVAHPDDDMLWGGAHLIEDDYLVVCVTCGTSKTRLNEFSNVMKETGNSFIALGYPDKTNGKKDDWTTVYDNIKNDIEFILKSNDWEKAVTHNKDGEYGHIHHIKTNKIVTEIYEDNNYEFDLYFFGKYYSKDKLVNVESELVPISDSLLERKEKVLELYKSQEKVIEGFSHMNKYEVWQKYNGE